MSFARMIFHNLKDLSKKISRIDAERIKAGQTAAKVEAFRLRKALQQELRRGAPGGVPVKPLSEIAKMLRGTKGAIRWDSMKSGFSR